MPRCLIYLFVALVAAISPLSAGAEGSELTPAQTEEQASWDGSVFRINDSKTRVSIASVKLSVSDLKREGGNLVGEYTIEVPLMSSKNDKGRIVLPLDSSMTDIGAKGGVLRGKAISYQNEKTPNLIICEIIPHDDQKILLNITTDDRILEFTSRYIIVDTSTDS